MTPLTRTLAASAGAVAMFAGGFGLFARDSGIDDSPTSIARRGSITAYVTEAGVLRAAASVTVRSPVEGRELEVTWLAPEGSDVREGDVLARLETTALAAELERAELALRQVEMEIATAKVEREEAAVALRGVTDGAGTLAVEEGRTELQLLQARAKRLRDDHDRLQPLLAKGYITREELDRAGMEADEAEARAALGERAFRILTERTHPASVQTARLQLSRRDGQLAHLTQRLETARAYVQSLAGTIARCTLTASHPGLVVYEENFSVAPRRKIRTGDRVTPSQGLITLPDLRHMIVEASVRESDVRKIAPGQPVRVTLDAFPELALDGRVAHVGSLANTGDDRATARFDVAIRLDSADARLRPAMNARVDIGVAERRDVVIVNAQSVFQDAGGPHVYVQRHNAVERRTVRAGISNAIETEIVEGLAAGDRVLLAPPASRAAHERR